MCYWWQKKLRVEAAPLSSLSMFKTNFMSLSRTHPIWTSAGVSPYEVEKATIQARMLSGRYRPAGSGVTGLVIKMAIVKSLDTPTLQAHCYTLPLANVLAWLQLEQRQLTPGVTSCLPTPFCSPSSETSAQMRSFSPS